MKKGLLFLFALFFVVMLGCDEDHDEIYQKAYKEGYDYGYSIALEDSLAEKRDAEDTAYRKGYDEGYNEASKYAEDEISDKLLSEYEKGYDKGYQFAFDEVIDIAKGAIEDLYGDAFYQKWSDYYSYDFENYLRHFASR